MSGFYNIIVAIDTEARGWVRLHIVLFSLKQAVNANLEFNGEKSNFDYYIVQSSFGNF